MTALSNGDKDAKLWVQANNGRGKVHSVVELTVDQLIEGKSFTNEKRKASTLTLGKVRMFERAGFVDYLRSGWSISFSCAIDYT